MAPEMMAQMAQIYAYTALGVGIILVHGLVFLICAATFSFHFFVYTCVTVARECVVHAGYRYLTGGKPSACAVLVCHRLTCHTVWAPCADKHMLLILCSNISWRDGGQGDETTLALTASSLSSPK